MQEDFERLGIGGEHDELRLPTIKSLGGLVGTFFQLLIVCRLW